MQVHLVLCSGAWEELCEEIRGCSSSNEGLLKGTIRGIRGLHLEGRFGYVLCDQVELVDEFVNDAGCSGQRVH
jgi:hypothetical protein